MVRRRIASATTIDRPNYSSAASIRPGGRPTARYQLRHALLRSSAVERGANIMLYTVLAPRDVPIEQANGRCSSEHRSESVISRIGGRMTSNPSMPGAPPLRGPRSPCHSCASWPGLTAYRYQAADSGAGSCPLQITGTMITKAATTVVAI